MKRNWFNRIRIHSTLEYLSPIEYKSQHLKNCLV
ncbi:IS3 family transposase [Hazenella sp. IB182357]|uniref:IS3 family transposase n=1 Tax=Polycladospora coralii TaxID=2771432 RepID=A0A926NH86_9BACL|nr:IS3 family transposase [Polycladospora coralii]